jgi:hypothetical protein
MAQEQQNEIKFSCNRYFPPNAKKINDIRSMTRGIDTEVTSEKKEPDYQTLFST